MVNGLAIPVGTGIRGGASIEKASRQKSKVLKLALSEGDDTNAFQDLGLRGLIFDINSDLTAAEAKIEIDRILKKFEGSIEIDQDNPITIFREPETGDAGVTFKWIDLDTNLASEFRKIFERAGGS